MAQELAAKPLRDQELSNLQEQCAQLKKQGVWPHLKVILVGDHPPSVIYTRNKKNFCESFGARCEIVKLPESISEADFLKKLSEIASDADVNGCFVQLPLPKQLSQLDVGKLIPPEKDVDGFHPLNLARILEGDEQGLVPCTPKGIMTLLDYYNIDVASKHVVIIGRSLIVGKPLSLLMTNHNATVTLCHSRTQNLENYTKSADIIVSAVGIPKLIGSEHLRQRRDQVLIDVGMNKNDDGSLCGDMDLEQMADHCSAYTPVPGGIGPMTIFSLAQNLLQAARFSLQNPGR